MGRPVRDERGETLTGLLVALTIGGIVMWAAIQLTTGSMTIAARATDRAESVQRARTALDRVTTVLGSQTCLGADKPPVQTATTTSLSIIADLGGEAFQPELHTFTLDTATSSLVETIVPGSGAPPNTTFTGAGKRRVLTAPVSAPAGQALFRYYAFDPVLGAQRLVALTPPLSATDRARVVRIAISLAVRPQRTGKEDARAVTLDAGAGPSSLEPTVEWQKGPRCG